MKLAFLILAVGVTTAACAAPPAEEVAEGSAAIEERSASIEAYRDEDIEESNPKLRFAIGDARPVEATGVTLRHDRQQLLGNVLAGATPTADGAGFPLIRLYIVNSSIEQDGKLWRGLGKGVWRCHDDQYAFAEVALDESKVLTSEKERRRVWHRCTVTVDHSVLDTKRLTQRVRGRFEAEVGDDRVVVRGAFAGVVDL